MRSSSVTRISQAMIVVGLVAVGSLAWTASALAASTAPPTIESESVSHITEHDAILSARIDPNGLATAYKLQIDTTGNFKFDQSDSCVLHPPGIACAQVVIEGEPLPEGLVEPPEGSIPAGYETQQVSVDLASIGATLQPDTTYHYRAIAANDASVVEGPDQTFTTPPGTQEPSIESESVSHITPTDATLEAQINTEGLETTYEFHLLERWGCEESTPACYPPIRIIPLPSGKLLGSFVGQTVSLDLNSAGVSLSPGHNFYEYSVSATNAAGATEGQPLRFTTPSAAAQAEPQSLTEPSVSIGGLASTATQSPTSGPPSHSRRHRHHHRHRRGLHRSKLKRQRPTAPGPSG